LVFKLGGAVPSNQVAALLTATLTIEGLDRGTKKGPSSYLVGIKVAENEDLQGGVWDGITGQVLKKGES